MIQTVIDQIELLATALHGAAERSLEELGLGDFTSREENASRNKIRAIKEAQQRLYDAYTNLQREFPKDTNN